MSVSKASASSLGPMGTYSVVVSERPNSNRETAKSSPIIQRTTPATSDSLRTNHSQEVLIKLRVLSGGGCLGGISRTSGRRRVIGSGPRECAETVRPDQRLRRRSLMSSRRRSRGSGLGHGQGNRCVCLLTAICGPKGHGDGLPLPIGQQRLFST